MNHHHHSIHGVNPEQIIGLNNPVEDQFMLPNDSSSSSVSNSHAYDDLAALVNEFIEDDHGSPHSRFDPILHCRMPAASNESSNCNHLDQSITAMNYGSGSVLRDDDVYDELIQAMEVKTKQQ